MSDSHPAPFGVLESTPEEAARRGAGPDDPPPPMPWADVFEAAVVHVDRAGTPRDAAQLAAALRAGDLNVDEVPEHLRGIADEERGHDIPNAGAAHPSTASPRTSQGLSSLQGPRVPLHLRRPDSFVRPAGPVIDLDAEPTHRSPHRLDDPAMPDLSAPDLARLRRSLVGAERWGELPDPGTVALLVRAERGDITYDDVVAELHARIARGELGTRDR